MTSLDSPDLLTERFEAESWQRRAVAYRMLGSLREADDAVQEEAWLRLSHGTEVLPRSPPNSGRLRNEFQAQHTGSHKGLSEAAGSRHLDESALALSEDNPAGASVV